MRPEEADHPAFREAVRGLLRGDFSRLEPLFEDQPSSVRNRCRILEWYKKGARIEAAAYPTGNDRVDEILRRHGAKG